MKPLSRSPPPPVLIYSWTRSAERNPCPLQPVGGAVLEQGSCAGRPGLAWGSLAQVGGGRRRYLGGLPPSVDGDLGRAGAEQRTRQSWGADSWEGRELGGLPRRERVWVGGGGGWDPWDSEPVTWCGGSSRGHSPCRCWETGGGGGVAMRRGPGLGGWWDTLENKREGIGVCHLNWATEAEETRPWGEATILERCLWGPLSHACHPIRGPLWTGLNFQKCCFLFSLHEVGSGRWRIGEAVCLQNASPRCALEAASWRHKSGKHWQASELQTVTSCTLKCPQNHWAQASLLLKDQVCVKVKYWLKDRSVGSMHYSRRAVSQPSWHTWGTQHRASAKAQCGHYSFALCNALRRILYPFYRWGTHVLR